MLSVRQTVLLHIQFHAESYVYVFSNERYLPTFFLNFVLYLCCLQDRDVSMAEKTNYLLFMINAFQVFTTRSHVDASTKMKGN